MKKTPERMQQARPMGAIAAALVFCLMWWVGGCRPDRVPHVPHAALPATDAAADYSAEVSRLVSEEGEVVSVLANGMTVIARRVATPVLSVRGYVRAGGVYEGRWLGGGLSHLLEHIVAGGSNQRRSEAQDRALLQEIGNHSNAYTSATETCYFVNTTADNLDKAADLVTGWMLGARITPEEFAREREVVQRELEKNEGEPDWVFYQQTLRNRYLVSPARVPTIGYKQVIAALTRDDVYEYYRLAYQPGNMVFAVAGDLPPQEMVDAIRRHVRDAAPGRAFSHDIAEEPPVTAPRTLVGTFPDLGQAKLQLAFPTIKLLDEDLYALDLLATVLGQGPGSILVQEIRDRRRLVTGISAWSYTPHHVSGTFGIDMELDAEHIPAARAAVLEQIERIKAEGVSAERLKRAKTQTRAMRAFGQQTSADVAGTLASDYLASGDVHFTDRYVQRIGQVTGEQVRAMAVKYLDPSRLLTTALVPEEATGGRGLAGAQALLAGEGLPAAAPATAPAARAQRFVLPDGTVLLVKRINTAPIAVMNMYALGGLTAEDQSTNGLGNLAMRMVDRGTKTRSAAQIAEFFDSIGGSFSASCGNNTWSWSASCLRDDLPAAAEVFWDLVRNASFPQDELAPTKQRIAAAIAASDADWFGQSMRFFRQVYFGPGGSPYQFLAMGTRQNLERFTIEQVREWYATKVMASPRVLAVYGDVEPQAVLRIMQQHAGSGAQQAPAPRPREPQPPEALGESRPGKAAIQVERVEVRQTSNPQAGVFVGFHAPAVVGSPRLYPLTIADTMASGFSYPTGYLFEALRGRGLVYDVQGFIFPGRSAQYTGAFVVYAVCDPAQVHDVVEGILENVARLQTIQQTGGEWFERARRLAVVSDALERETPAEQATAAALDELFGLGYEHHERFADKIAKVTAADVEAISRQWLSRCVVAVTTPMPDAVRVAAGARTFERFAPVELTPHGPAHEPTGR